MIYYEESILDFSLKVKNLNNFDIQELIKLLTEYYK